MSRVSHMESCLLCGSTTSSAPENNNEFEILAGKYIALAAAQNNHAALRDLAIDQIGRMGGFSTTGSAGYTGPAALYRLRRARIAQNAMAAMVESLEPKASDEHHFDSNGHLQ